MNQSRNAIVVITYNRLKSLKRLIESLYKANYLNDRIDLIISMDNSGDLDLKKFIEQIDWPHGKCKKVFHEKRLGLKKHVLFCGDFCREYENLFVFEDDLYVSKNFYIYGKQAIEFYKDDENIAGISLYTYQWNQYANKLFQPLTDKYDVYLMKVASSWGQVWMRNSWFKFRRWMENKSEEDLKNIHSLPTMVSNWSSHSWLKYHHAYLAEENKYFVYPRVALSTNFSEPGQHAILDSTYQVELSYGLKDNYLFVDFENGIKYDSFYEIELFNLLNLDIDPKDITIDLYGTKKYYNKYLITTRKLKLKPLKTFALRMRPHELNVIHNIEGSEIYLYDLDINIICEGVARSRASNLLYYYHINNRKSLLKMWIFLFLSALKRKFF